MGLALAGPVAFFEFASSDSRQFFHLDVELQVVELPVKGRCLEQFAMGSDVVNLALVHHDDLVCLQDR